MDKVEYKWKFFVIFLVLVFNVVYLVPNLTSISWWLTQQKLNYGLDIQGGLHLVMGIDIKEAFRSLMTKEIKTLNSLLAEEGIATTDLKVLDEHDGVIEITLPNQEVTQQMIRWMDSQMNTKYLKQSETENKVVFRLLDAFKLDYQNKIMAQSLETIRNRIDEFGVAEPSIVAQGNDRILVQLPGVSDAESAKKLISSAAYLEFMLVEDRPIEELQKWIKEAEEKGNYSLNSLKYSEYIKKLNEDLREKLPAQTIILFEKAPQAVHMESGRIPYLLRTDTGLDGSMLEDAFVSFDQFNNPEVSLSFNSSGAKKFKEITGKNIGRRLAAVLDKVVKTAPNIRVEIPNGRATITLGGGRDRATMLEEAKMIATTLRAGALPATLEQLEERRIGPTLGIDSLKKAQFASYVGAFLVFFIMMIRYRTMGLLTSVALLFNVTLIIALLTTFKATLTLPGIAGIALTVGVAVDANVLIFERIREELKRGLGFSLAVKEGYSKALSAILDANIVVGATSIILLYFGTGPIRGFAVTLLTGIITTLFCQVFVTQSILEWLLGTRKIKSLSI